jgi:hypothetical protein
LEDDPELVAVMRAHLAALEAIETGSGSGAQAHP